MAGSSYPSPAAPGSPRRAAAGDEGALFERHNHDLVRAVTRSVSGPPELVADACQRAWLTLLRYQPERTATLFGWLYTVAVHEAYRIWREERSCERLDDLSAGERESALGAAVALEDELEARRALEALASLPLRQRQDLALAVAGYTYAEIAGGRRSLNNVNKHLTKARVRLRRIAGPDGGG